MLFRPVCSLLLLIFFLLPAAFSQQKKGNSVYTYGTASPGGTGKFYFGREIANIISPSGASWLDRNSRQKEENSDLAVKRIGLKEDDIIADIGAGTGYYSFRLAKYVPQGKVYAVEVQDEFVTLLNSRIKDSAVNNIEAIKGGSQSPNLPESSLDYVLMVDVYHELEYPHEMLTAISKILKPGGRLILMEYKAEDPEVRIRPLHKTSEKQIRKELEANGFQMIQNGGFLPIQHFFVFEKSGE